VRVTQFDVILTCESFSASLERMGYDVCGPSFEARKSAHPGWRACVACTMPAL